ncbi:hypothetical protein Bca4012_056764 [Brassica carinata]
MMKKKKSSSSESLPPSFLSLPHDIVFNTLARISRTNYPILSLVSKSLRSLLSSPDLEAARSLIGRPEKYLHVCLNLNNNNPSWFILSQRKLIPTPSFPYQHLKSSSVVSTGSETYIIGGGLVVNGREKRSKRVFLIDFITHQWRKLPNMLLSRKEAVVEVMDGKAAATSTLPKTRIMERFTTQIHKLGSPQVPQHSIYPITPTNNMPRAISDVKNVITVP